MTKLGGRIIWGPMFIRRLSTQEEDQFMSLQEIVNSVVVLENEADLRCWMASKEGIFCCLFLFVYIRWVFLEEPLSQQLED